MYTAERHGCGIAEVPVHWQEIDGSKLTPLTAALQMARDLFLFRSYFVFGVYKFKYFGKFD